MLLATALAFGTAAGPLLAASYVVLHAFTGGADGAQPYKGPTLDSKGNLYSETFYGAFACADSYLYADVGCGTVYKTTPAGVLTTLTTFNGINGVDGFSNLTLGVGTLYGTAYLGGADKMKACSCARVGFGWDGRSTLASQAWRVG